MTFFWHPCQVLYFVLFIGESVWINVLFSISGFPVFCMLFFLVSRACVVNKKVIKRKKG